MNIETQEILEQGSLEELDFLLWEIKETLSTRQDIEEVAGLLDTNGILLEVAEANQYKICNKKRPV